MLESGNKQKELSRILQRIDGVGERLYKSNDQLRTIADEHMGCDPQDPATSAPVCEPGTTVQKLDSACDGLDRLMLSVEQEIQRLTNL